MESQGEEREDRRLVSEGGGRGGGGGGGGDELFRSCCQLVAEFAAFIINRLVLFYLIFQYHYPDSSIFSYLIYLTNMLMEAVYLCEILDEPILTHPIHALAGRTIFWIERFTQMLSSTYFQSGKFRILAGLLFCFTNTVFISKFMLWIHKSMNHETQRERETFVKAEIVDNDLQEEKLEPKEEPLKAEIVEEEKLPEEKVGFELEAEIVEDDKSAKEKVEMDQERLEGGEEMVEEDKLPKEKVEFKEPAGGEMVVEGQASVKTDLFEEDKLPKKEVEVDGQALKLVTLDDKLVNVAWEDHSKQLDLGEFRWLAAAFRHQKPKAEPRKTVLQNKSPPLKKANVKWNKDLLQYNGVCGDDDDYEDSDEEKDGDVDSDEEEGYEYPKLKVIGRYKFSAKVAEENISKDYKEQCLILEEEKKALATKLAATSESLEQYLQNEKDYLEDRNNWVIERDNLCLMLDQTRAAYSLAKDYASKASLSSTQMQQRLVSELAEVSSLYQYCQVQCLEMLEDRNGLSSQLYFANSSAEFYKACLEDSKYECRKLREERDDLSERLIAETSYAEYYHQLFQEMVEKNENLVKEMEERNRNLEEENNNLAGKLHAVKVLADLYRSCLHDCGI